MYPSFSIYSFIDGHLGCFQHLAIVNCAATNTGVHRFFWTGDSGFLNYNPSSRIAGSKAVWFLVFWGNSILFSTVAAPVCIPTKQCTTVSFSLRPHQHLFVDLFIMTILTGVKWNLIVVLIWISLSATDAEHPFKCLWAFCMSPLENCLFRSVAHFLVGLFDFLVLSHMSSSYILKIKPLPDVLLANMFSHTLVPFSFCWCFL